MGVDEREVAALLDKLIALGFIEERPDGELGPTRRWNARLQAAAEQLNQLVAKQGFEPAGNPLMHAIAQALLAHPDGILEEEFDDAVRLLAILEVARMKPDKRSQLGFGDLNV